MATALSARSATTPGGLRARRSRPVATFLATLSADPLRQLEVQRPRAVGTQDVWLPTAGQRDCSGVVGHWESQGPPTGRSRAAGADALGHLGVGQRWEHHLGDAHAVASQLAHVPPLLNRQMGSYYTTSRSSPRTVVDSPSRCADPLSPPPRVGPNQPSTVGPVLLDTLSRVSQGFLALHPGNRSTADLKPADAARTSSACLPVIWLVRRTAIPTDMSTRRSAPTIKARAATRHHRPMDSGQDEAFLAMGATFTPARDTVRDAGAISHGLCLTPSRLWNVRRKPLWISALALWTILCLTSALPTKGEPLPFKGLPNVGGPFGTWRHR
jgi:hypothetical protein